MKSLKELTFEEVKQLSGGNGLLEPWHGLPPNYYEINPSKYKKGLNVNDWIIYSKQFI